MMRVKVRLSHSGPTILTKANADPLALTSTLTSKKRWLFALVTDDDHSEDSVYALLYLARNLQYADNLQCRSVIAQRATPSPWPTEQASYLRFAVRQSQRVSRAWQISRSRIRTGRNIMLSRELGDVTPGNLCHRQLWSSCAAEWTQWNAASHISNMQRKWRKTITSVTWNFTHWKPPIVHFSFTIRPQDSRTQTNFDEAPQTKVQMRCWLIQTIR